MTIRIDPVGSPLPLCPICGKGQLLPAVVEESLRYRETRLDVPFHLSQCDNCGSEITAPEQARRNDFAVREQYKVAQRLLSGEQVRAIRAQLHLTQKEASRVFGGGSNSFAKYETGRVVQSKSLDLLLRVAGEQPELLGTLRRLERHVEVINTYPVRGSGTCLRVDVKAPYAVINTGSNYNVVHAQHETLAAAADVKILCHHHIVGTAAGAQNKDVGVPNTKATVYSAPVVNMLSDEKR